EILGEKRQPAQFLAQFVEQLIARTIHPLAADGGRFTGRDFPELREAAKVIEADEVAGLRGPAQSLDPPLVTLSTHGVPVVQRIAPALAGRAVGVGRNA